MPWYWIVALVLIICCIWIAASIMFYRPFFKRFYDFILSGMAILALSPVILALIIVVAIKMKGNPFFTQDRLGKDERVFRLYKFRSMTDERDETGALCPDEVRLTPFGRKLRATSLDELPSLFNILKGDMSIIGPRPLPTKYRPYYTEEEHHRHDVRPGLTGLAQVNGRNYVTWEDKFRMDLEYISNISFMGDVKLILQTVGVVLKHENIDTGSFIEKDGVIYRPLNVERSEMLKEDHHG